MPFLLRITQTNWPKMEITKMCWLLARALISINMQIQTFGHTYKIDNVCNILLCCLSLIHFRY